MLRRLTSLAAWAALLACAAAAAEAPADFDPGPHVVTFTFENDLFGDTDAQYTNGMKLSYLSPDLGALADAPGVPAWLLGAVSRINALEEIYFPDQGREFNVGFALGQMMYTPDDTQATALIRDDRPYAGWLYGALTLVSKNADIADTLEIQLGMIGPASLAEDAQKLVHDIRDLPLPRGWDNQLDNEPGGVLYFERKWRLAARDFGAGLSGDVIAHAGLALGNVYDYLAAGGELRFGWNLPRDFGTSVIRPGGDSNAPAVSSAHGVRARELGVYGFAAFGGRLVGRDIFLDGNTFADSHDVDKKIAVGDFIIGGSVVWRAAKLSYAQVFRTKEFDGQRRDRHNFGSISLSLSF
ncbi:MAG: lipid A deacylase LpxR family protein [Gammaproteobacteria bacterium]|nr:lipid A deacylase LpxR family protein [Gammaproteobacteria bacterium]MCP5198808.1 lipid A deacylase LpxR family protein [Gammaproteobacteria bacterium]